MDKTLYDFTQTEIFKKYDESYNILYVEIVGSRKFNLEDEKSDFDIIIFVEDRKISNLHEFYKGHFLKDINNKRLHWYLLDINYLNTNNYYKRLFFTMSNFLREKDPEKTIINKNPEVVQILNNNKDTLFENSLNLFLKHTSFVNTLYNLEKIDEDHYSKHIYRIVFANYLFFSKEVTEEKREYLLKLKRMRWLDDEYRQLDEFQGYLDEALKDIKELVNYFKYSDIDREKEVLEIIDQIKIAGMAQN